MRILAIAGSLDPRSANAALARALTDANAAVTLWDELGDLPYFRPDADPDSDEHVVSLRNAVAAADAVLVATPEYAGGMPGALKNALDWLVGTGELYGKRVAVVSAAPSADRGHNARRWVEEVARMQGATVTDSFSVALAKSADADAVARAAEAVLQRLGVD